MLKYCYADLEGKMFERFTDEARRVLVIAQEEARALDSSYIGTEHILLALTEYRDSVAGRSLEILGLTHEALYRRISALNVEHPRTATAPPGSPPFTPRAKKVLELSLREALQLGHNYIGTEHLLLGIVREGGGIGMRALVESRTSLEEVRATVIEMLSGYSQPKLPRSAVITFQLPRSLELAVYARSRDLRQAIGSLDHELPVPLVPTATMSQECEMSLERCRQYIGWCERVNELFGLPTHHPFMIAKRNIEAAVMKAEQAYLERLRPQHA